jgi:threonine dehydrogenase-like Zn-dependent dehydrogenase
MSPQEAVFLANMETAVNLTLDAAPQLGEKAVIFGQGIVGLLTTALMAMFPLSTLVTLDLHPLRREQSMRMGARDCLDPSHLDTAPQLERLLGSPAQGGGADLTFELSGNPDSLNPAIDVTGFDGRIVVGSWYGDKRAAIDLGSAFHRRRLRLVSSQVSTIAPGLTGRWTKSRRLGLALELMSQIQPSRLISHTFPIASAAEAYRLLDRSPEACLQVVFTYP